MSTVTDELHVLAIQTVAELRRGIDIMETQLKLNRHLSTQERDALLGTLESLAACVVVQDRAIIALEQAIRDEIATQIANIVPYGAELRADGSEHPGMGDYLEGLRDACELVTNPSAALAAKADAGR